MGQDLPAATDRRRLAGARLTGVSRVRGARCEIIGRGGHCDSHHRSTGLWRAPAGDDAPPRAGHPPPDGETPGSARRSQKTTPDRLDGVDLARKSRAGGDNGGLTVSSRVARETRPSLRLRRLHGQGRESSRTAVPSLGKGIDWLYRAFLDVASHLADTQPL